METYQIDILLNRMNDRILYSCVLASLLVHMVTIPAASLMIRAMPATPVHVPIDLVNVPRVEEAKTLEASPPSPASKSKAVKITAPKLISKPEIIATSALAPNGNTKEEIKEPEKLIEQPLPGLASLPPEPASVKGGWNMGERPEKRREARPEPAIFSARAMWVSWMGAGFQMVVAERERQVLDGEPKAMEQEEM